jgi:hypothetical protein
MRIEYRRVNIDTLQGIKQAEKLQAQGWVIGSSSPFDIEFYQVKKIPGKKSTKKVK